jgi:hypothetical protein
MASSSQIHALISLIAKDNNLNADELIAKYAPPASRRRALVQIVEVSSAEPATPPNKCTATTAKGKPCAAKPLTGTCLCRVHTGRAPAAEPVAPPAPRRAAAPRRAPPPVHTHELDDQVHDSCELCQSHGNTLANPDGEEEYETVSSPVRDLRDRLMMLATEDDFEDEEDEA